MSTSNVLLALGGLALGAVAGVALYAAMSEPERVEVPRIEVIEKELTPEQLEALCSETVKDDREALADAQTRFKDLESTLAAKEAELAEAKKQVETDANRRAAAAKKWKEMEAEIEQLKAQLVVVEQERDELTVKLKETVQELNAQIKETERQRTRAEKYKSESQQNLWTTFEAQAKVEICDRGSRRRHEKCHEAVDQAVASFHDRFMICVDTYQATPTLIQAERGAELPQNAAWLNDDNRFTKRGWYIQFCDPTLPEAGGEAADREGMAPPSSTGGGE